LEGAKEGLYVNEIIGAANLTSRTAADKLLPRMVDAGQVERVIPPPRPHARRADHRPAPSVHQGGAARRLLGMLTVKGRSTDERRLHREVSVAICQSVPAARPRSFWR